MYFRKYSVCDHLHFIDVRSKSTTEVSYEHLGQMADSIVEWRGPIADQFKLTPCDVANIEAKHPQRLNLQTYECIAILPKLCQ